MEQKIIQVEADSLEEARKLVESQIPSGYRIASEQIISDGKPIVQDARTIEVEADTLEEAQKMLGAQIFDDLQLVEKVVTSNGNPVSVRATGETTESAFAEAEKGIPDNAIILEKAELAPSKGEVISLSAQTENDADNEARFEARTRYGPGVIIKSITAKNSENKGMVGDWKKRKQYEAEVLSPASVQITYKPKAKIVAKVGRFVRRKATISVRFDSTVDHLIRQLEQSDPRERSDAIQGLSALGDPSAIAPLTKMSQNSQIDEEFESIVKALEKLGASSQIIDTERKIRKHNKSIEELKVRSKKVRTWGLVIFAGSFVITLCTFWYAVIQTRGGGSATYYILWLPMLIGLVALGFAAIIYPKPGIRTLGCVPIAFVCALIPAGCLTTFVVPMIYGSPNYDSFVEQVGEDGIVQVMLISAVAVTVLIVGAWFLVSWRMLAEPKRNYQM